MASPPLQQLELFSSFSCNHSPSFNVLGFYGFQNIWGEIASYAFTELQKEDKGPIHPPGFDIPYSTCKQKYCNM